jgi:hypothetical protein
VNPDSLSHAFAEIAENVGLGDVRFHDLRHGYSVALLRSGVSPKLVSAALGHSRVRRLRERPAGIDGRAGSRGDRGGPRRIGRWVNDLAGLRCDMKHRGAGAHCCQSCCHSSPDGPGRFGASRDHGHRLSSTNATRLHGPVRFRTRSKALSRRRSRDRSPSGAPIYLRSPVRGPQVVRS